MGELFWVVVGMASGTFAGYWKGRNVGFEEGYDAGQVVGQRQGIDLAKLNQSGKDSARARKAAATRKQRAAYRDSGNSRELTDG